MDEGWDAKHRFLLLLLLLLFVLFFAYWRYEKWMSVSCFKFRWGIDECPICFRWALSSWVSSHHQGRRVQWETPMCVIFVFPHIEDMRTGWVSHFLMFGKVSMIVQSVFGEFWEKPASSHHQWRREEWEAPFVFLFVCCILKIWELTNVGWGIDECSICFRWALSKLSFLTSSGTKGWMQSMFFCFFAYWRYENWMSVSCLKFRWGIDECSICFRWALSSWISSHHQGRSVEWEAPLFVSFVFRALTIW